MTQAGAGLAPAVAELGPVRAVTIVGSALVAEGPAARDEEWRASSARRTIANILERLGEISLGKGGRGCEENHENGGDTAAHK